MIDGGEMNNKRLKKKKLRKMILFLLGITISLSTYIFAVNHYVEKQGAEYICSLDEIPQAEAILILGAYVLPNGTVSGMLEDRLAVGDELYKMGKAPKIIVSGDHGQSDYDEVNSMKSFLVHKGVPAQDIFMDHAGFSTYESMYRARDIFKVQRLIIVTQEYHLKRAVFDARGLGIEAGGVSADRHDYGQVMDTYKLREIIARNKDFLWVRIIRPKPTYLGEPIPVFGDGGLTDDK